MFDCNIVPMSGLLDNINRQMEVFNDWSTPDVGFPDRRMWSELDDLFPSSMWTRKKVSDIYGWYETAVKNNGVRPYQLDANNMDAFNWIAQNTSYSSELVNQFATVFIDGLRSNWLDPKYASAGTSPSQLINTGVSVVSAVSSGVSKVTLLVGAVALVYALKTIAPFIKIGKK